MRKVSALRAPRPADEGSFVGRAARRLFLEALSVALIVGLVAPAHAANVTVLVSVVYTRDPGPHQASGAACAVSVAENADGLAVLSAAKSAGCIRSYTTITFPGFGTFIDCISDVCGVEDPDDFYWYWGIHLNLVPTAFGVDGYRAHNADHLMFLYQVFPPIPSV